MSAVDPKASVPAEATARPWRRRFLLLGAFLLLLAIFHAPILRLVGGLLVVDDAVEPSDYVVLSGVSGPYRTVFVDEAVELEKQGQARGILLIENRSSRIVQSGIVPTIETVVRRELAKRGVAGDKLTVVAGEYPPNWDMTRAFRDWLEARPDVQVTFLCNEFHSRDAAHVFQVVLGEKTAARVRIRALPDKRFDVSNWWKSRHGIVEVASAYVTLLHTYVHGEPTPPTTRWNADEYVARLQAASRP